MSDCIADFKEHSQRLAENFLKDARVSTYLKGHAKAADDCVTQLALTEGLDDQIALVALGGYGRRELFPCSDLDVMVLTEKEPDKECAERIEHFLMRLWDMGLTVGSSVRTVESALEESAKDITVQTAVDQADLNLAIDFSNTGSALNRSCIQYAVADRCCCAQHAKASLIFGMHYQTGHFLLLNSRCNFF